jgi:hypothetical protein
MFDFIVFIIVIFVIFSVVFENIRLKNKNIELLFLMTQLKLDNESIKKKILSNEDIEKDHLINFLSETRELAFNEIEKLQKNIKEFIDIADKEFNYFDEYGILMSQYPHYNTLKKVSEEYKKLKNLLPNEVNDGR